MKFSKHDKWFDYNMVAKYYDEMMKYIPYNEWATYIVKMFFKMNGKGNSVIDLGSGTGVLASKIKNSGFDIVCADISIEMLKVSQGNFVFSENVFHINSDITDLPIKSDCFNLAICIYDTANHLNREQFSNVISQAYRVLKRGGILMFDFNTHIGLKHFAEETFIRKGDDFNSIWKSDYNEKESICTLDLNILSPDGTNKRIAFSERPIEIDEVKKVILKHGFSTFDIFNFMTYTNISNDTERGFAVCMKT